MAKIRVLADTDVFIDYLNRGFLGRLFAGKEFEVFYSIVTHKELFSKKGLKVSERMAITGVLKRHRIIQLNGEITAIYSDLRRRYPALEKEDALIAATALFKKIPLVTRNRKHFKPIHGLVLFVAPAVPN